MRVSHACAESRLSTRSLRRKRSTPSGEKPTPDGSEFERMTHREKQLAAPPAAIENWLAKVSLVGRPNWSPHLLYPLIGKFFFTPTVRASNLVVLVVGHT